MSKVDAKELAKANGRAVISGGRVGVDELTGLDEVVADGRFHLEYMSKRHVWIGVETATELIHINLWIQGKKIYGRVQVEEA